MPENVENTSYGTFSTVREVVMCYRHENQNMVETWQPTLPYLESALPEFAQVKL